MSGGCCNIKFVRKWDTHNAEKATDLCVVNEDWEKYGPSAPPAANSVAVNLLSSILTEKWYSLTSSNKSGKRCRVKVKLSLSTQHPPTYSLGWPKKTRCVYLSVPGQNSGWLPTNMLVTRIDWPNRTPDFSRIRTEINPNPGPCPDKEVCTKRPENPKDQTGEMWSTDWSSAKPEKTLTVYLEAAVMPVITGRESDGTKECRDKINLPLPQLMAILGIFYPDPKTYNLTMLSGGLIKASTEKKERFITYKEKYDCCCPCPGVEYPHACSEYDPPNIGDQLLALLAAGKCLEALNRAKPVLEAAKRACGAGLSIFMIGVDSCINSTYPPEA